MAPMTAVMEGPTTGGLGVLFYSFVGLVNVKEQTSEVAPVNNRVADEAVVRPNLWTGHIRK